MKLTEYSSTFWGKRIMFKFIVLVICFISLTGVKVPAESSVSQTCQKSFQLTMACLKIAEGEDSSPKKSSLYFKQDGSDNILLCTLDNSNQCQRLNLVFRTGDKIDFFADGPSNYIPVR